jgi:hypothetical protein
LRTAQMGASSGGRRLVRARRAQTCSRPPREFAPRARRRPARPAWHRRQSRRKPRTSDPRWYPKRPAAAAGRGNPLPSFLPLPSHLRSIGP